MATSDLSHAEAQTRSAIIRNPSYDVTLDLTGERDFRTTTIATFEATVGASTFIEAYTNTIESIELNGTALDAAIVSDGSRIRLDGLEPVNTLRVTSTGTYTHSGEGPDRFVDPVDGRAYLYTEFAVAEACRVFAVFDQPDLKAKARFTITAPNDWVVLSNSPTPKPRSATHADHGASSDASTWRFEQGPLISSYLFAIIAGPYHQWHDEYVTEDGRRIPLGVYSRESLASFVEPEVMFDTVKRGIAFYERLFGVKYPFGKYDQIFVPEYNWGAMENVGAVTFNESYIFRSKQPVARHEIRVNTVLHELSHMWFGDLVTMQWWNDLWLNESFATFAATTACVEATDYTAAWASFAADEKTGAATQDQLPSTHPIVATIERISDVESNFDGITYDKGASVLKQLAAWVGRDAFFAGIHAYLVKHSHANATLDDLLGELERSSGRDVKTWSRLWLETAGVNTLKAEFELDDDGRFTTFEIVQTAAQSHPTLRPHRLAVGIYAVDARGRLTRVVREEFDVSGDRTPVPALVGVERGDLILVNDDDLTYAKIRLDERSLESAITGLSTIDDPVARAVIWGAVWDATRDAEMRPRDYVSLVAANVSSETQSLARQLALRHMTMALDRYVEPDERERVAREAAAVLWESLEAADPGSDEQLQLVRAFATTANSPSQLRLLADIRSGAAVLDGLAVEGDLSWELLIALAAAGAVDDAAIEAALELDRSSKGIEFARTARAAVPTAQAKDAAWRAIVDDPALSSEAARSLSSGWQLGRNPEAIRPSMVPYFSSLETVWAARSFAQAELATTGLFPAQLADDDLTAVASAWLETHPDAPAALRRVITEGLAGARRAIAAQRRDALEE